MKSLIVANENTSLSIPIGNFRNNVHHKHVWDAFKQTIVELLFAVFGEKSVPDNTIDFIIGMITDGYSTFSISDIQDAFVKCARMTDTRIYNGQVSVSQVTDILDKYNELYKIPKLEQENRSIRIDEKKLELEAGQMTRSQMVKDLEAILERIKSTTILLKMEDDLPILGGINYKTLFRAIEEKYQIELDSQDLQHYRDKAKSHIGKDSGRNIAFMSDKTKKDRIQLNLAVQDRRNKMNNSEHISQVATLLFIRDFIFKKFKPAYMVKIEDRMKDIIIERVGKNLELTELELKNRLSFPEEFSGGSEQIKMEITWKEICEKYAHKYALMSLARKNTSDFLKTFK